MGACSCEAEGRLAASRAACLRRFHEAAEPGEASALLAIRVMPIAPSLILPFGRSLPIAGNRGTVDVRSLGARFVLLASHRVPLGGGVLFGAMLVRRRHGRRLIDEFDRIFRSRQPGFLAARAAHGTAGLAELGWVDAIGR